MTSKNDEKDRYGDKLRELERAREDKYFADKDKELLEKLRHQKPSAPGKAGESKTPASKPEKP